MIEINFQNYISLFKISSNYKKLLKIETLQYGKILGKNCQSVINFAEYLFVKKNLSKTCLKAPQKCSTLSSWACFIYIQFWILCWFSIFFSSLPGLEIHTSPIECDCQKKKWTTLNCLTDVNRFSELFYILLEVYRIDLKVVIELSAEKVNKGQKEFHDFFIPG